MTEQAFKITWNQREHVSKCLRYIDEAREALAKKGPGNEAIIEELKKSADGIYHLMRSLEEL
jgi:hypothetical protein